MWAFPGKIYDEITAHEAIAKQLRLGGHIQVDVRASRSVALSSAPGESTDVIW